MLLVSTFASQENRIAELKATTVSKCVVARTREAPENNLGERDIRSVAAAGGLNRTKAGATAFANLKSIVRTCRDHGQNFLSYGLTLIDLDEQSQPLPFSTLAATPVSLLANTS